MAKKKDNVFPQDVPAPPVAGRNNAVPIPPVKLRGCMDFDGVFTDGNPVLAEAQPLDGLKEFLEAKAAAGIYIICQTHNDIAAVAGWLHLHVLDALVPGGVTNVKPEAAWYLDDRAVRFNGDFEQAAKDTSKKKRIRPWWK